MGSSKFITGIREYLSRYKFGNAATLQLLEILQKHFKSKVNLIRFMKTWTELPGFPVVNVRRSSHKFELFQKRFLNRGSSDGNSTWDLPIRFLTNRKEDGVQFVWFLANATCGKILNRRRKKYANSVFHVLFIDVYIIAPESSSLSREVT